MEGVKEVRQLDDKRLHWRAEVGGKEEEWDAEITEQIPDTRIARRSVSGPLNAGVVDFHRLNDENTQVSLQLDAEPEGVLEKIGEKADSWTARCRATSSASATTSPHAAPPPASGAETSIRPTAADGTTLHSKGRGSAFGPFPYARLVLGPSEGWPSPVDGSCLENSRGDEPPGVRIPLPPPEPFRIRNGHLRLLPSGLRADYIRRR